MAAGKRFRGGLERSSGGKEDSGAKESENYCREDGLSWEKLVWRALHWTNFRDVASKFLEE